MPQDQFLNEKQKIEKEIQKLERQMRTLQTRKRRPVINSIIRSMLDFEITPEEITKAYEKRGQRAATTSKAPVRFIDPSTGDTWTGRGRPPRWITEAESQGKSRDDFLIES